MKKKINLSKYNKFEIKKINDNLIFAIVVAEWNSKITNALYKGAIKTLEENGVNKKNLITYFVPGSFELPITANLIIKNNPAVDAVICLGCIIKGETPHNKYISSAVANAIMQISTDTLTPVIFGVLTTNNYKQAEERAGGKHGNKGVEAAFTAIKMAEIKKAISSLHK